MPHDFDHRLGTVGDGEHTIELKRSEVAILGELLSVPIVDAAELLAVTRYAGVRTPASLESGISVLRRKLAALQPLLTIVNRRGYGYQLKGWVAA